MLCPEIVEALGVENVSIDAWPQTEEDHLQLSGYVWTDNAYFAANAPAADLEASWALGNLLTGPDGQARLAQSEGSWFLPVLPTVLPVMPLGAQAQDVLSSATAMPLALQPRGRCRSPRARRRPSRRASRQPRGGTPPRDEIIRNELTQSPPGG